MDLDIIREFHQFAKTLNYTQAARNMNLSLSTLSRHIQNLENELGVSLVKRAFENGFNTLTVAGQQFIFRTRPWLDEYDDIVVECHNLQALTPPVRIYGTKSFIINAPAQLQHALSKHGITVYNFAYVDARLPGLEVLDRELSEFFVYYEAVKSVRWLSDPEMAKVYGSIPLAPEPLSFMASAESTFGGRNSISLSELENYKIIVMEDALFNNWLKATTEIFNQDIRKCHIKAVPASPLFGGAFPITPDTLAMVTDRFAKYYKDLNLENVVFLEIEDLNLFVYPFLIYRKDTPSDRARQIIDALKAV
jgi:DNA-binding transcriptional LysR family regulator